MWLPRPGHKRHVAAVLPPFGSLAVGEASRHVVRALKQPHGTALEVRSWGRLPPALWMTPGAGPPNPGWLLDCSLLRDPETEPPSQVTVQSLTHRNCEIIVYYSKPLSFRVICYIAMENMQKAFCCIHFYRYCTLEPWECIICINKHSNYKGSSEN